MIRLGRLAASAGGLLTAVCLLPLSAQAATQASLTATYVRTIGGPGHAGMYPSGMEVAPNGNLVIADTGNDQIAEYTPAGTQLWRVGSEGNAASSSLVQFMQPRDVGVDTSGNVYVADNGNGRVVKLDSTGKFVATWKAEPSGSAAPIGITVNTITNSSCPSSCQRVYVADANLNTIAIWDTSGTFVSRIQSQGSCTLNRSRDAAADPAGDVYVANYVSNNILEFSATGTCIRTFGAKGTGNGQFKNPYGVAIGNDPVLGGEAVYVADSNNERIQEFTPTGTYVAQAGTAGSTPGTFTQLRRVAVDSSGNVWGADLWGNRIERFLRGAGGYTYDETLPNPLVGPGNTDTSVFNQVRGIAFDAAGDILSMDTVNQRVVVMSSSGHLLYTCGQRGFSSVGEFNWPRGVAMDNSTNPGSIWIADTKQSYLQILTNTSACGAVAKIGKLGTGLGQLDYPDSIAISGSTAWVADTKNNRVSSWSVSGHTAISNYGTKGKGTGQFSTPAGIGVDPTTGHVFVADSANKRVVELSVSGGNVTGWVKTLTTSLTQPFGVAADGKGHVAVADRSTNQVVVLNESDGSVAAVITGSDVTGGGPTSLLNPENVAFGPNGDLYIADTYNDRILEYSLA